MKTTGRTDAELAIIRDALRDLFALREIVANDVADIERYTKAEQLLTDVDAALRSLRA